MNPPSNFHTPLPGESAIFYCINCKKSFSAKVPSNGIFNFINQSLKQVKCPDCKTLCGFDPKIKN